MTEPQPVELTAFLATAECAILDAAKRGTEGAGEGLISAGCWYAPRLLAAVVAALGALDIGPGSTIFQDGYRECADRVREAITRELLTKADTDAD